nr:uncharacterized protein LOC106834966 isoform X2 [Equus asinus]
MTSPTRAAPGWRMRMEWTPPAGVARRSQGCAVLQPACVAGGERRKPKDGRGRVGGLGRPAAGRGEPTRRDARAAGTVVVAGVGCGSLVCVPGGGEALALGWRPGLSLVCAADSLCGRAEGPARPWAPLPICSISDKLCNVDVCFPTSDWKFHGKSRLVLLQPGTKPCASVHPWCSHSPGRASSNCQTHCF